MIALLCIAAFTAPELTFDAFFDEFAKKRDAIQNLDARFRQETVTPEEKSEAAGRIIYVKPKQIKFSYEAPQPGATYLIDTQKVHVYHPDARQLEIRNIEDSAEAEAFFLGFSENTKALRDGYEVSLFEPEQSGLATYGIILHPKKTAEAAPFQEVRLYLREQDYLPVRIHIVNDEESRVDIEVTDIKVNLPAETVSARLEVAEGTKVIEDDTFIEKVGPGGKVFPVQRDGQ